MHDNGKEIFFNFIDKVRDGSSNHDLLKEFGGGSIYVPSFKNCYRNIEIIKDYNNNMNIRYLALKYQLSKRRIQVIISQYQSSIKRY